jgi:UDP-GlcNAc3NAcA epimerase
MKICTIVGARPQFIKAAVVSREILEHDRIQEIIIHTGQHYDANMSDYFFDELDIPKPMYNLNIGSSSHGVQTGQMLGAIEAVLLKEKPDWVLVYGDTNSTLAGALAAAKIHIPIAHVEAGLRSFNRNMPEEINRIMTDHISSLLLAPTERSARCLFAEGIAAERVVQVGDVMYDAAIYYNNVNTRRETMVSRLNLIPKSYILTTVHRAENTDNPKRLNQICDALIEFADQSLVVFPMHPRTRLALEKNQLLEKLQEKLMIIDPIGYLDMLALEKNAKGIVTDSGGMQKEAYFNRVPCVTLRDETEWVELVEGGWNHLCSPDVKFHLQEHFDFSDENFMLGDNAYLYGDGNAGAKIINQLLEYHA